MNNAFRTKLAAKRAEFAQNDKGFTLIELLVVVLIIGILTAIAVPVFIGQQNQAKDAAAKSDLGVAKVAVISYYTSGATAQPTAALIGPFGYVASPGTKDFAIQAGASSTSFCIQVTSDANNTFHITGASAVTAGACT